MFSFIKEKLQKIYAQVSQKLSSFFEKKAVDQATLKELELILLASDAGVKTTRYFIDTIQTQAVQTGPELYKVLERLMIEQVSSAPLPQKNPDIILMVGINGSGKTTSCAKLANYYKHQGKRVLLIAADTFRAAAVDQLQSWAERFGIDVFTGLENQKDPAAVVFSGCKQFIEKQYDLVIIDTAGRLQTKQNLMQELGKIYRTIIKAAPNKNIQTLLTIDGMLGQNSFDQAKLFNEITPLDGIIITKMDGTAKGGIVFAIVAELQISIIYISFGESIDAFKPFNPQEYVSGLLAKV